MANVLLSNLPTYTGNTNVRPFTWGNLDSLQFNGSYEGV